MTTSNALNLTHLKQFFSLSEKLEQLDLAPTATGGLGIDNSHEFPPPAPRLQSMKGPKGTQYAKGFIEQEKEMTQILSRQTAVLPSGSTVSLNHDSTGSLNYGSTMSLNCGSSMSLNRGNCGDVDGLSTLTYSETPNDLQSESTKMIYSTYYPTPQFTKYNPELPITPFRLQILQQLEVSSVLVIQGSTGCGKTTQVPQYILDQYAAKGAYCNIVVTQPRRIAAIGVARRVCQERNWELGTLVGYQVAMENKTISDTRLSYVTTGVLVQKLVSQKRMDMYTHVIIDEVHERDQDTDFVLLIVKKLLKYNSSRVKVILMSATFDTTLFAKYFNLSKMGEPAPVIDITGKTKEVTEHYLHELKALGVELPIFDVYDPRVHRPLYELVVKLMLIFDRIEKSEQGTDMEHDFAPSRGAVLIFLPGYEEISAMCKSLKNVASNRKYWILPLHSTITVDEQTRVFRSSPPEHRKVIISTNIAESSITVPDIKYVIDFCLTKSFVTDTETNYSSLRLEWAPKANCIQRKGRAGRVDIGRVYRLVPRQFYEKLPEYGIPEMKRHPLTDTILKVKKLNFGEPQALLAFALDPPDLNDIQIGILQLKEALALTITGGESEYDGELTVIGNIMANLPLDVKLSKLIILGYVFNCLEDCIIIAASLSLKSFLAKPFEKILEAYKSKISWADGTFSDCLAYLHAYRVWKRHSISGYFKRPGGQKEIEWGESSFVQIRRIRETEQLIKEIKDRLAKSGILINLNKRKEAKAKELLILKIVIAGAFFPYYYFQEAVDEKEAFRDVNNFDPYSTVYVSGLPSGEGVLYASAIRDLFLCCGQTKDMHFENKKVYVQFDKSQDSDAIGQVILPVYLACKMRYGPKPLEFSALNEKDAKEMLKQLRTANQGASNRFKSSGFSIKLNPKTLKPCCLPPNNVANVNILVTHVINCGHFWARYTDSSTGHQIYFLENLIATDPNINHFKLEKEPEVDMLVLAPFTDSSGRPPSLYRAQIKEVMMNGVKVFFVDYGNTEIVKAETLREIHTEALMTTTAMAFECKLVKVKPSSTFDGQWSPAATSWFRNEVNGVILDARVYSVVQNVVHVELRRTNYERQIESLNQILVLKRFAVPNEESILSKENHDLREKCCSYQTSFISMKEIEASNVEVTMEDTVWENLEQSTHKIRLIGPNNPLQVGYKCLTNIDSMKSVFVEPDSVNSVSFNTEPQDKSTSMLVASNVTVSQKSGKICARSTTLMPNILGLPALLCLMFSPYAELRSDKKRTRYIGALCGLGYNKITGESLYPEHDIQLPFDIQFEHSDVTEINVVRGAINHILAVLKPDSEPYTAESLSKLQENMREYIYKIVQKKREPKEVEYGGGYDWQQTHTDYQLTASVNMSSDWVEILSLIDGIALTKQASLVSDLTARNTQLYKMIQEQEFVNYDMQEIKCLLCCETVYSTFCLRKHLMSTKHKTKENELLDIDQCNPE